MTSEEVELEPCAGTVKTVDVDADKIPQVGDWLWRHWYARLWWISIFVFWAGTLLASRLGVSALQLQSAFLDYLAIILHPQTALHVLGLGFVWSYLNYQRREASGSLSVDDNSEREMKDQSRRAFEVYRNDPISIANRANPLNSAHPSRRH